MSNFYFYHLRAEANHNRDLLSALEATDLSIWGVFTGLFGLASNEVYVVLTEDDQEMQRVVSNAQTQVVRCEPWQPTARPTDPGVLSEPGLYVFRSFLIQAKDVDELVELSQRAWETFETNEDYQTKPVGLFRPLDQGDQVPMQLVTWYDGFDSWEKSRTPAPDAIENFRRRHALTSTSNAVATRLVQPRR